MRQNVLYIETAKCRYEIARLYEEDNYLPSFKLAEVKNPFFKDEAFFSKMQELPLCSNHLEAVICT